MHSAQSGYITVLLQFISRILLNMLQVGLLFSIISTIILALMLSCAAQEEILDGVSVNKWLLVERLYDKRRKYSEIHTNE